MIKYSSISREIVVKVNNHSDVSKLIKLLKNFYIIENENQLNINTIDLYPNYIFISITDLGNIINNDHICHLSDTNTSVDNLMKFFDIKYVLDINDPLIKRKIEDIIIYDRFVIRPSYAPKKIIKENLNTNDIIIIYLHRVNDPYNQGYVKFEEYLQNMGYMWINGKSNLIKDHSFLINDINNITFKFFPHNKTMEGYINQENYNPSNYGENIIKEYDLNTNELNQNLLYRMLLINPSYAPKKIIKENLNIDDNDIIMVYIQSKNKYDYIKFEEFAQYHGYIWINGKLDMLKNKIGEIDINNGILFILHPYSKLIDAYLGKHYYLMNDEKLINKYELKENELNDFILNKIFIIKPSYTPKKIIKENLKIKKYEDFHENKFKKFFKENKNKK